MWCGVIPIIWTYCVHPIWKFSKVTTTFANQISCMKFVEKNLDTIIKSERLVSTIGIKILIKFFCQNFDQNFLLTDILIDNLSNAS